VNRRRKILIALGILLFIGIAGIKIWRTFSKASKPVKLLSDVEYVPGSNNPFQTFDLYVPRKAKHQPFPVIVWIHGGAWMSGDKNHPPVKVILEHGYALVSLNYRLTTHEIFPAQIYDCKAAIRFLRAHASEYKLDPDRIGVWGGSAGGHLAALLGTSGDVKALEGDLGNNHVSSRVQAVVDWAGPSDLATIASQAPKNCKVNFKSESSPIAALMGKEHQSQEDYLSASPVHYVSADDPPFFIAHAEDDDVVPVGQARELEAALSKAHVPVQSRITRNGGHSLSKPEFVVETMNFFDKYLRKK
jgi:acetyl esterase/lipase